MSRISYSDSKFCCWKGDFLPDMQRLFKKNQRSQRQNLVLLSGIQLIKQTLTTTLGFGMVDAAGEALPDRFQVMPKQN